MGWKRWLLVSVVLVCAPLVLFAAGPVKLTWWVGSWQTQENKYERQAYDFEIFFEREHPNIDLVVVPVDWEGMHDKLLLATMKNNNPHIMDSEDCLGWTAEFASTGNIMDLTDFMKNKIGLDKWAIPTALDNATYNGRLYSFPYRNSTRAFVWNKDLFKKAGLNPAAPPKTWDQVVEYGKKITQGENFGFSYPLKRFCTVAPEYVRSVMDAYGADITSRDLTKGTINTPQAKEAIRFWTDLVTKQKIVPMDIINNDDNNDFIMFGSGITGMCMVGPWVIETYKIQSPNLNYGVTTIPGKVEGKIGRYGLTSMGHVIRKDVTSAEREAIYAFLETMIRPEVNVWYTDDLPAAANFPRNGKNPINGKVINFLDDPYYAPFYAQLKGGGTLPSALLHPAGPKIAQEVNVALQRIILGQDLNVVLDEANVIIDDLLNSR
jgi:multiple sugar transport system substrate-binding protein